MDAKDNEFGCIPSLGPSLSCAFGVNIVKGRIKLKHLNICLGQNIIQLKIKWTIDIVTKYHSMDLILSLKLVRDDALRI